MVFLYVNMRILLVICICFILWGCAGNGQGLDENGNPIGDDGGNDLPIAFDPTFTNIQQNVFNVFCIECHSGAFASQGLRLEQGRSYQRIVGIASTEQSSLKLVEPGSPDHSYLIHKLEGGPEIFGSQMPQGRPPLPQNVINSIRVWIQQGAPQN